MFGRKGTAGVIAEGVVGCCLNIPWVLRVVARRLLIAIKLHFGVVVNLLAFLL